MQREPAQNAGIWIAICISLLALVTAIIALNRTTEPSMGGSDELRKEFQQFQQQMQLESARQRLEDAREAVEEGVQREQIQKQIAVVRRDLQRAYVNSEEQAQQSWRDIDRQLDTINEKLREGSVDILQTIDALLEKLRDEIEKR